MTWAARACSSSENWLDLLPKLLPKLISETEQFDDFDVHQVEFEVGHPPTFVVCLSPAMDARLVRLAVDIQWVTTWEHRADSTIAPLCGLPSGLPVLTARDEAESWGLDWRFLEVRRAVERDPRPFVWIDDDPDFFQDGPVTARDWAAACPFPVSRSLPKAKPASCLSSSMPWRTSYGGTVAGSKSMRQARPRFSPMRAGLWAP